MKICLFICPLEYVYLVNPAYNIILNLYICGNSRIFDLEIKCDETLKTGGWLSLEEYKPND